MKQFFNDTETFSTVDIGLGIDRYRTGVECMLFTYASDDRPAQLWDVTSGARMPNEVDDALSDPKVQLIAHNSNFDRTVIRDALKFTTAQERWFCTMACAYAHGLPGSLEVLGNVLGLSNDMQKLTDGKRLIQLFCKLHRGKRNTSVTHPADWKLFSDYAVQDTAALREVYKRLPKHNYTGDHHRLWVVDQKINWRGFEIDQELCRKALELRDGISAKNEAAITELTNGYVTKGTQRARILHHMVGELGFMMLDLKKDTIDKELAENHLLTPEARRLLELRRDSSMTSLAKYERGLERVGVDGRMRDTLQFSGAGRTGRWAGRGFQPHNMPRPKHKWKEVEQYIEWMLDGTLADKVDDVNQACQDALRGTIIAADGCELIVGDWSNIEGVCNAWEADAHWKLAAFRENYFGDGPDMYVLLFAKSFGRDIANVNDKERQMGKGMELSMGYGGGVGAFVQVAATYRLDLDELGRVVPELVPAEIYNKAEKAWERAFIRGEDYGLDFAPYIACDALKQVWRKQNPEIVQMWWDVERAVKWAIERPGSVQHVAHCKIWCTPAWLIIELPSTRRLLYAQPQTKKTVEYDEDTGKIKERVVIQYMAATAKQWRRERTYGGKLVENITQAIANDVLRAAMLRADDEGYPQILHVHDEMVAESPIGLYTLEGMLKLMEEPLEWAPDLPLKAAGYTAKRYRKD